MNVSESKGKETDRRASLTALQDPDCILCLRKKLRAISVVVFFKEGDSWRIGGYQSDKPREDAEIDFYCLLNSNIPEEILDHKDGLILSEIEEISDLFESFASMFQRCSLIGAPVSCGEVFGARLAWRDSSEPFSESDLSLIRCSGKCPEKH